MTEPSHPPASDTSCRTKLNNVLTELRACIPSLGAAMPTGPGKDQTEYWQEQTPAEMLDEATIARKAAEYISHLEERNRALQAEHSALQSKVVTLEALFALSIQPTNLLADGNGRRLQQDRLGQYSYG
ncbi:hypothetical protein F5883DRAFT_544240 [Diaporthe sp. PMI_573]|nr:hypothetical protein F5883DRAFT_544240 [Diaporthaceae sp. PMI_573]